MTRLPTTLEPTRGDWSPAMLRAALNLASDAILFVAPHSGCLIDVNQAACQRLGYCRDELVQMRLADIDPSVIDGEMAAVVGQVVQDEMQQATVRSVHLHRDGTQLPVVVSLCRVDSEGDSYLVVVASEAVDRGQDGSAQSQPIACDPLTGLPGRIELQRQLDRHLLEVHDSGGRFALLFIDVDGFKEVNDTLGHLAGDQVLKTVAHRLSSCLRPTDVAVRFGGDEFVAVVTNVRCVDDVIRVAERVQQAMSEAIDVAGLKVTVSASIGIAVAADARQGAAQLLEAADQAMYRAKARGRQGFYEVSCDRVDCGYSTARSAAGNGTGLNIIPLSSAPAPAHQRLPR